VPVSSDGKSFDGVSVPGLASVDGRSRTRTDIRELDVRAFFEHELPGLLEAGDALAVPGARLLAVEPFTVSTPSGSWTLALDDDAITVRAGAHGHAEVRLDDAELARLVDDLITPMTLLMSGDLRMAKGDLGDFLDWWVVLRSVVDGRPAHVPGAVTFRDRDGRPLDLGRTFRAEDADREIGDFLAQAGFLHLAGWFEPELMDEIDRDIDQTFVHYEPDDGRSWWARTSQGEHRAVRLQGFQKHSVATEALLRDDRFLRIAGVVGDGHVARDSVEALVKPIGVVEGISDVPWHKDCSPGMHSYQCSGLVVGVSITASDDASGQLAVVAGSHRALIQPTFHRDEWQLPIRALPTAKGDVTVHCTCTMHMSHPPVDRERRVLYTAFTLPSRDTAGSAEERALWDVRAKVHQKVSQKPSPVA
jgi:hypothetical protein